MVESLADNLSLNSFSSSIKNSLLVLVNEDLLLLDLRSSSPLLCCSQLSNKVKSLFLSFEHHVLLGSSSNKPLKKINGQLLLVLSFVIIKVFISLDISIGRSLWPDLDLAQQAVFLLLLVLDLSLLNSSINGGLGLFKSNYVSMLLASKTLFKVELNLVYTHPTLKDPLGQSTAKLLETLIGC